VGKNCDTKHIFTQIFKTLFTKYLYSVQRNRNKNMFPVFVSKSEPVNFVSSRLSLNSVLDVMWHFNSKISQNIQGVLR